MASPYLRQPTLLALSVPGLTGSTGATGATGPQGLPGDYGFIRYGEMIGATPRQIPAGQETPFVVQSPTVITDDLKPPFAGFAFLGSDNILRARKSGDSYFLSVRFSAIPALIGGWLRVAIYVAGNISSLAGPTSTRTIPLEGGAGSMTRVDELFEVFPAAGYLANGATISLFASVPVTLSSDVLFVTPQVAAP